MKANRLHHIAATIALCLLMVSMLPAQQESPAKLSNWEFGLETVRLDFNKARVLNARYTDRVQALAGVYARKFFRRTGFRFGLQMGRHHHSTLAGMVVNSLYVESNSGFTAGIYAGGHVQILPRRSWLLGIADLSLQHFQGYSEFFMEVEPLYRKYVSGMDEITLRLGLSARLPIGKHLTIGTEWTMANGLRNQWLDSVYDIPNEPSRSSYMSLITLEPMGNLMVAIRL